MYKNYFKNTIRHLLRNKVASMVKIFGLTIGMSACFILLKYITLEKNYDNFHVNANDIYRVSYKYYKNGEQKINSAKSFPGLGLSMKNSFPEVIDYCRIFSWKFFFEYNNVTLRDQSAIFVDTSFFNVFSFSLLEGSVSDIKDPSSIIISQEAARKFFGTDNPIGKTIKLSGMVPFIIKGIFKNIPFNSHMKFDYIIPYSVFVNFYGKSMENGWDFNYIYTYLLLKPNTDIAKLKNKFPELINKNRNDLAKEDVKIEFDLQKILNIHLDSNLQEEFDQNGNRKMIYFLTIVAILILIVALINFINLSIVQYISRAKEVGVRNVVGAYKFQIKIQIIFESFLINLISAIISIVIVLLITPYISDLLDVNLDFIFKGYYLSYFYFILLFIIGTIGASLYPAFLFSTFDPIQFLKGKFINSQKGSRLKLGLLVFQFIIAIGLLICTITVVKQLKFMKNQYLGFNKDQVIVVKGPTEFNDSLYYSNKNTFKLELEKYPNFKESTSSFVVPGMENSNYYINSFKKIGDNSESNETYYLNWVDYNYINVFEIKLLAGKNFSAKADNKTNEVILDETSCRLLGFKDPNFAVNMPLQFGKQIMQIVGVVGDYRQRSFSFVHEPTILMLNNRIRDYYSIKLRSANVKESLENLKKIWSASFNEPNMDYFFLDDFFNKQYEKEDRLVKVFFMFSILTIIIACIGIYGIVFFENIQRKKEIAIRKILGSSIGNILLTIYKNYIYLVMLAFVISASISFFILNKWLNNFSIKINLSWWMFCIPLLIVILILIFTVSYNTYRVVTMNPTLSLKDE